MNIRLPSSSIRTLVLAVAAIAVTGASASAALTPYDNAINALNPVAYFKFETGSTTADVDTSIATGANAISGYSLQGIASTASSSASRGNMLGVASTYNAANNHPGFGAVNNVAQYSTSSASFISSVTSDGTTGIANAAAFKSNTSTAGMTVSTWARIDALPPASGAGSLATLAAVIIGTSSNTAAGTGFQLNFTNTGIRVGGRSVSTDGFQSLIVPYATAGYTVGEFVNIVGVADYANDKLTLYIDGLEVGSGSATFANTTMTYGSGTSAGVVSIGGIFNSINAANTGNGGTAGGQLLTGYSDQAAFFNRVLTAQEIHDLYTVAVPEPTSLAALAIGGVLLGRRRRG